MAHAGLLAGPQTRSSAWAWGPEPQPSHLSGTLSPLSSVPVPSRPQDFPSPFLLGVLLWTSASLPLRCFLPDHPHQTAQWIFCLFLLLITFPVPLEETIHTAGPLAGWLSAGSILPPSLGKYAPKFVVYHSHACFHILICMYP